MTTLDTAADIAHAYLIQFDWGDGNVARYAAWTDDIVAGGNTYETVPEIEVFPEAVQGGVEDKPWVVRMIEQSPVDQIATGYAHAPTYATIMECAPSDPDNTLRTLLYGKIGKLTANAGGRRGIVRFEVEGIRLWMRDRKLGIPATTQCAWTFGDKGCCVELGPLRETRTIDAISGLEITLDALTTQTSRYWHWGSVEVDGLRIMIRSYTTGLTMTLARRPPPSWLNASAVLTPGCAKTIEICRSRWNNEARFAGIGFKIPAYHPIIEAP